MSFLSRIAISALILGTSLTAAAVSHAAPGRCLEKLIREWSIDKRVCESNFCYDNVIRLAGRLVQEIPGFNLDQARVLYIMAPETGLRALRTKKGPYPWAFHVVLEYQGKVLDLDYLGGVQHVLSLDEYLKKMFFFENRQAELLMNEVGVTSLNNRKIIESVRVRSIPAADYLRDYGYAEVEGGSRLMHDFRYYISSRAEAEYPSKSIASILKIKPEESQRLYATKLLSPRAARVYESVGGRVELVRRASRPTAKVVWDHKGIIHEFDLKDGSVLLNDGYKAIDDPAKVQVFLKKIYYQMHHDPALKQAIEEAKALRKADPRLSPH